jgi:nitrogenase molybdenum-iron protein beta chain
MKTFIDRPRYSCALGGALFTLRALPRTIPIIHASAGCGYNLFGAASSGAGYFGGGYCGGAAWSSTNVVEREIVFGGDSRLEEQIRTTLELMDGDLYVVVTGCMVEMIGDDVLAVTAAFEEERAPVLAVPTPSFKGDSYDGYDMVLSGLFRRFVRRDAEKRADTVNLLGIVPGQDAFYKGNLTELRRLLERMGLRVNTFFGEGETLENLRNASEAGLNIVLSERYGVKAARAFEETHGTPYIILPFPVGAAQTAEFLRAAAKRLNIGPETAEALIYEENDRYYDYVERLADIYNDADLQRYAVVVGDLSYAPAVSRFVSDELGWIPKLSVITDQLTEEEAEAVKKRFQNWESGVYPSVTFDANTASIKEHLSQAWPANANERYYDSLSPAVIIGSVLERDLAVKYGMPLLAVSFPVTNRAVMHHCYTGYTGGLNLISDLITLLVSWR